MIKKRLDRKIVENVTVKDALYLSAQAGAQGITALIPNPCLQVGANCGVSFLFGLLESPMEKRRNEWIEQIENDVMALNEKIGNLENRIRSNPNVLSVVLMVSQMAMKTHSEYKLKALRNIITNTIIQADYEEYKIQMFLNIIDSFTEWHIRVLDYFAHPKELKEKHSIEVKFGQHNSQPSMQVFWGLYPQMVDQKAYVKVVMDNLFANGLISVNGKFLDVIYDEKPPLGIFSKENGPLTKRTTELGDELLKFIRYWEE